MVQQKHQLTQFNQLTEFTDVDHIPQTGSFSEERRQFYLDESQYHKKLSTSEIEIINQTINKNILDYFQFSSVSFRSSVFSPLSSGSL